MAKKLRGITPENLRKLIAHLEGLPVVEPAIIPTKIAIGENRAAFRAAMNKGHTLDQLVDIYNEYGSTLKPDTFAGHLRDSVTATKTRTKGTSGKTNGASTKKTASRYVNGSEIAAMNATLVEGAAPDKEHNADEATSPQPADAFHIQKAPATHTAEDEDARVDEILMQLNAGKAARSDDG